MVTSTVLSITKQGGFEFLHGRFFSVIFVDNVYYIRKILIYIHATFHVTKQQGAYRRQLAFRPMSIVCFYLKIKHGNILSLELHTIVADPGISVGGHTQTT